MPRAELRQPKSQIRTLREACHLSQKDLANQWQVSINTVRSWETKSKSVHTLVKFVRLCEVLSCSPRDLVPVAEPSSQRPKNKALQEIRRSLRANSSKLGETSQEIRIAELREAQELTQKALAAALEVSLTTIQNWENGRTGLKQLPQLIKLCEILNCKHTDLLDFIPRPERTEVKGLSEIRQSINKRTSSKTNLKLPVKPTNQLEAIEEK